MAIASEEGHLATASTVSVPAQDRAQYWERMVSSTFARARCVASDPASFEAEIRSRVFGQVTVCEVFASAATSIMQDQRDSRGPAVFIGVPVAGSGVLHQAGTSLQLRSGEAAVYGATGPFRLDFPGPHRMHVARIPWSSLAALHVSVGLASGLAHMGARSNAGLLGELVSFMAHAVSTGSQRSRSTLGGAFVDMLVDEARDHASPQLDPALVRREAAEQVAREHSADPNFTVSAWARIVGISERELRRLFADGPSAPARFLGELRLEHARRLLQDPRWAARTLQRIAISSGFSGAAHMGRVFRERWGISPGAMRSASAGPGA